MRTRVLCWTCAVAHVLLVCVASPELQRFAEWIHEHGAVVKGEVRVDPNGVRGLFATQAIARGDPILVIPGEIVLNIGGPDYETPILALMREIHSGGLSRFQPYLDILPKPGQVLNGCNLPQELVPMLQSSIWEQVAMGWQAALWRILNGEGDDRATMTLPEALGARWRDVTLDDLRHACALAATRDVVLGERSALLMVPIFDLANHRTDCTNIIRAVPPEYGRGVVFLAGQDILEGEEICAYYMDLRDDYAFIHYGFLPPEETPPRLWLLDHPGTNNTTYADLYHLYAQHLGDQFEGTEEEMWHETDRLGSILRALELDDTQHPLPPRDVVPNAEHVYDMLLELRRRRRAALVAEQQRLRAILAGGSEGKVEL